MISANGFLAAAELRALYDQWEARAPRIKLTPYPYPCPYPDPDPDPYLYPYR